MNRAEAFVAECFGLFDRRSSDRRWGASTSVAAVFLFALSFGCASAPTEEVPNPESTEVATFPESQPIEADLEEKLKLTVEAVERAIAAKEYRQAIELARAAPSRNAAYVAVRRLFILEERAKQRLFNEQLFDAFVDAASRHVIVGEPIRGDIVITNISGSELVIRAPKKPESAPAESETKDAIEPKSDVPPPNEDTVPPKPGGSERTTLLRIHANFREFWPDYSIFTAVEYHNIEVDEDIRLAPGESRRVPFAIDSMTINGTSKFLREVRFSADIHCGSVTSVSEEFHGVLEARGTEVRVFPKNSEHLSQEPLAKIAESIRKRAPLHLTLAAGFLESTTDREAAVRTMRAELAKSDDGTVMAEALMSALRIVTGLDREKKKSEWLEAAAEWRVR